MDPEEYHGDQGDGHDDALDQVGGGHGQEAAHDGIQNDHRRADQHGDHVIEAEQAVEQLADGGEAGGGVGDEEDDYNDCGNGGEHVVLIAEAA